MVYLVIQSRIVIISIPICQGKIKVRHECEAELGNMCFKLSKRSHWGNKDSAPCRTKFESVLLELHKNQIKCFLKKLNLAACLFFHLLYLQKSFKEVIWEQDRQTLCVCVCGSHFLPIMELISGLQRIVGEE